MTENKSNPKRGYIIIFFLLLCCVVVAKYIQIVKVEIKISIGHRIVVFGSSLVVVSRVILPLVFDCGRGGGIWHGI